LQEAVEHDAAAAIPNYLLGNLLFDKRPEDAIRAWTSALEVDKEFAMVWRNLAFGAFYTENKTEKAIEYLQKAIQLENSHPLWYAELATYYDVSDEDYHQCLEILAENVEVVKKDITAPKHLVKLYNLDGAYDKAIGLLNNHHFRTWEGGRVIYYHYVDAHTLKARELMQAGEDDAAIATLMEALEYPENLEVGKPLNDERNAMIWYYIGMAYRNIGDNKEAKAYFRRSTHAVNSKSWEDILYYQARSYEALGDKEKANGLFRELISRGSAILEEGSDRRGIGVEENSREQNKVVSEAYYLMALGHAGLDDETEARGLFQQALDAYENNLWARVHMENLR